MDTKKNFLFFLTPCIIAAVGLFVMMVDSIVFLKRSKGDSYTGIIVALLFYSLSYYRLSFTSLFKKEPGSYLGYRNNNPHIISHTFQ